VPRFRDAPRGIVALTFATGLRRGEVLQRCGKSGANAVSRRAGHANLSTTLEVYQTVFEEDDRALADLSAGLFNQK